MNLEKYIVDVVDWPKKGVVFKDITPLFSNPEAFNETVDRFYQHYKDKNIDKVIGSEARGFIIAAPVALKLGAGFIPARKKGKLPREVLTEEYDLEYGKSSLSIHKDSISKGDNVLLVDDLIATGGTAIAQAQLIERAGGKLAGMAFVTELAFFNPREIIGKKYKTDFFSLVTVN